MVFGMLFAGSLANFRNLKKSPEGLEGSEGARLYASSPNNNYYYYHYNNNNNNHHHHNIDIDINIDINIDIYDHELIIMTIMMTIINGAFKYYCVSLFVSIIISITYYH